MHDLGVCELFSKKQKSLTHKLDNITKFSQIQDKIIFVSICGWVITV